MTISLERLNKIIIQAKELGYYTKGVFPWGEIEYRTPLTGEEGLPLPNKVEVEARYPDGYASTYTETVLSWTSQGWALEKGTINNHKAHELLQI